MENLILSSLVTICVTTIVVVFIVSLFKHLDSTGFAFREKVIKDLLNLKEFKDKAHNTLIAREKDMMAMKERIDEMDKNIDTILAEYIKDKLHEQE